MSSRWTELDPFPRARPAALRVEIALRTDVGRHRARNEDRAVVVCAATGLRLDAPSTACVDVRGGALFALVCDGMGGEAGGDVASRVATDAVVELLRCAPDADDAVERTLVATVVAAGERVRAAARSDPMLARMGTTATLAAFTERALVCAQVGDSRAYVLREGRLEQVTRDQTMIELLRASGVVLSGDEIPSHVILQALGSSARLDVAVTVSPLGPGDVVLLCSDGLYGVVDDALIERVLGAAVTPDEACDTLVALANDRGGPDNVTCIVGKRR